MVKETAPYKFNVLCKPYVGNSLEYQINLQFEFTKHYPQTPLKYEIEPIAGLTRDNINSIVHRIEDIILNSNNRPVVFDIIEETRSWILEYLVEGKAYQEQEVETSRKVEVFERPKFAAFTPVTVENFLAWKKDFEMRHRNDKVAKKEATEVKLTGKQYFLGKHEAIVSSEDEDEDEDEEEEIVERVEVENELFNDQ